MKLAPGENASKPLDSGHNISHDNTLSDGNTPAPRSPTAHCSRNKPMLAISNALVMGGS